MKCSIDNARRSFLCNFYQGTLLAFIVPNGSREFRFLTGFTSELNDSDGPLPMKAFLTDRDSVPKMSPENISLILLLRNLGLF